MHYDDDVQHFFFRNRVSFFSSIQGISYEFEMQNFKSFEEYNKDDFNQG